MPDEGMLTIREVAGRLRLNPETVRRWLNSGKLRGHKLGETRAGWRIPAAEVQRFLADTGPGRGSPDTGFPTVVRVAGRYMKLMDMTREDLHEAVAELRQRGDALLAGHQGADTEGE
jgi:excisionase family DNA binding protein